MADIESVVRIHLTLLRAAGAGAATQVRNDWLSNHVAGPEQGVRYTDRLLMNQLKSF